MHSNRITAYNVLLVFARAALVTGLGLLIMLAVQLIFDPGITVESNVNGATLTFSSDRSHVFAKGECVTLSWDAQNIRAIYLGERGVTGTGREIACLTNSQVFTLHIQYRDGASAVFPIYIRTLIERTEVWIVTAAALFSLAIGALCLLVRQSTRTLSNAKLYMTRAFTLIGVGVSAVIWVWLVLELLLRLYFAAFGTQDQQISYVYSREEINARQSSNIPLPGVEFALSPEWPDINALGYRGDEISIPKPEGIYRIIAMGGSNTYGFFLQPSETYPAQLQQVLREDYGYENVEVINAGVAGYTSFHIAANFASRYLELEPDLAIYYESSNDVRLRERAPDCYRGNNPLRGLNPQPLTESDYVSTALSPSVLVRFVSINLGWTLDPHLDAELGTADLTNCGAGQEPFSDSYVQLNPPIYFERNLTNIVGLAEIHDIDLLFVSWSYRLDAGEIDQDWKDTVAEHNVIVEQVAERYHIPFLDYAALAPQPEENWRDFMHMSAEGSRLQAETIAAFIDERGLIPISQGE
jgi:lysophospholipase L1-like esterase